MANTLDNKTIYEIFRACRLCGAGGGYKMPIIPSVVGFDCAGIELRQKIRECVQIEVNQDDKMPPLICELCVDKVNDFYEFLEMCRNTNVKTRQRLGLPEQHSQNISESDDCILGVTEPVYSHGDDDEPLSRRGARPQPKVKQEEGRDKKEKDRVRSLKKELENLIKQENTLSRDARSSRRNRLDSNSSRSSRHRRSPSPAPIRETRQSSVNEKDNMTLSRLKDQQKSDTSKLKPILRKVRNEDQLKKKDGSKPKPILKKAKDEIIEIDDDEDGEELPILRTKRLRDKTEKDINFKKIKLTIKLPPESPPVIKAGPKCSKSSKPSAPGPKSSKPSAPGPKSSKPSAPGPRSSKRAASPPAGREYACAVCTGAFLSSQGLANHMRQHTVKYTPNELACNPCGEWFSSAEETASHHKQHKSRNKPYTCRGCGQHYRPLHAYTQHVSETGCVPWTERPDLKCDLCWRTFPTKVLMRQHLCGGVDSRPGGKCTKCNRSYQTLKTFKKHESTCTAKKKGSALGAAGRPLPAVRVARCDALLARGRTRCNVADVRPDFGLDHNSVYPYRPIVRVKKEPFSSDGMVSINKDVRDEFYIEEDYVHWDSDNSSSDEESSLVNPLEKKKKVPSLTTLSLKTIFSRRCLGKVPRKLRKVQPEKFDSFFNPETEFDVKDDIDNIINSLGDDDVGSETISGFSLSDIKLTDVKSINEMTMSNDNDSISIVNDANCETNYESDSLLDDQHQNVNEHKIDFDAIKNGDDFNELSNLNLINKHILNPVSIDHGSETDASLDDNNAESQNTKPRCGENGTPSENSEDLHNSAALETTAPNIATTNGNTENQPDLFNEINELYDKKLMDELDAQIGDKDGDISDKNEKILLHDLVPDKSDGSLGLSSVSEELIFDA